MLNPEPSIKVIQPQGSPGNLYKQNMLTQSQKQKFLMSTGLFQSAPSLKQQDELYSILYHNFQYPIEEDSIKHLEANRLGQYDSKNKMPVQSQNNNNQKKQNQSQFSEDGRYEWQRKRLSLKWKDQRSSSDDQYTQNQDNNAYEEQKMMQNRTICQCCSYIVQKYPLTWKDSLGSISKVQNLGPSTYLLFKLSKFLIFSIIMLFFVYCIFALVTNKLASNEYQDELIEEHTNIDNYPPQTLVFLGLNSFAVGSKITHETEKNRLTFSLSSWMALLMVFVWAAVYLLYKMKENKFYFQELRHNVEYTRISLFSIQFENLPRNITQKQLEDQLIKWADIETQFVGFQRFSRKVLRSKQRQIQKFLQDRSIYSRCLQRYRMNKIKSNISSKDDAKQKMWKSLINQTDNLVKNERRLINLKMIEEMNRASLLFYEKKSQSEQLKSLKKETEKVKKKLAEYIKAYCRNEKQIPSNEYNRLKEQYFSKKIQYSKLKKQKLKEVGEITIQKQIKKNSQPFFVTFTHQKLVDLIINTSKQKQFQLQFDNEGQKQIRVIKMRRAPQPQDIMWKNIGQTRFDLISKKFVSFFAAGFLLCIAFLVLLSMSTLKVEGAKLLGLGTSVSIIISIIVTAFNVILRSKYQLIKGTLYNLSKFQRNTTHTTEQMSIALKTVIALLINTTIIPLVIAIFVTRNIFRKGGLAEDVLTFAVINAISAPLSKAINVGYFVKKILLNLKQKKWPLDKFQYTQKQYNDEILDRERADYQIGFEYVDIVNFYMFICFFASLQPLIAIPGVIYFQLMYLAKKIYLYQFCKRPIPCSSTINTAMFYFISAGPFLFILGDIIFSSKSTYSHQNLGLHIPALILSIVFIFLFRYKVIARYEPAKKSKRDIAYEYFYKAQKNIEDDYDLLNPTTAYLGQVERFKRFQKKRELSKNQQRWLYKPVQNCFKCPNNRLNKHNMQTKQSKLVDLKNPNSQVICLSCGSRLYKRKHLGKYCSICGSDYCRNCCDLFAEEIRQKSNINDKEFQQQMQSLNQFMEYEQYYKGQQSDDEYYMGEEEIQRENKKQLQNILNFQVNRMENMASTFNTNQQAQGLQQPIKFF